MFFIKKYNKIAMLIICLSIGDFPRRFVESAARESPFSPWQSRASVLL